MIATPPAKTQLSLLTCIYPASVTFQYEVINTTTTVLRPFSGTTRVSRCQRELLDFVVQGEINGGRHTDHPAERHSIRTNQCLPPPSPDIFYRPDALPATQPTAS